MQNPRFYRRGCCTYVPWSSGLKKAVQQDHFYRPQRSCGQGNIFTPVCHSVHRGGGVVVVSHKALRQTPPDQAHCPHLDQAHHPPGPGTPPSRTRHTTPLDQAHHHPPTRHSPPRWSRLRHTVYERPVLILLECILVKKKFKRWLNLIVLSLVSNTTHRFFTL